MSNCDCQIEINNRQQRSVLIMLLLINASMFFIEIVLGFISQSTALIADSLDMLADATVYAIGLYAVGRSALAKVRAAHLSGLFQILLGCLVLLDVSRRFVMGSEPHSLLMMAVGLLALCANLVCLKLISSHRDGEVHMRASWVFSKNDVIANLGILLAAVMVHVLDAGWPDLLIGLLIAVLVVRGGISIVRDASRELRRHTV